MKKLAVTGGLACGKSSVCQFFKEAGAHVISADEIVHQLLSSNPNLGQKVINLLGEDVVVNKQINRAVVAKKVFRDQKLLKELENILNPASRKEIETQCTHLNDVDLFVAEIPLLFEAGWQNFYDHTIAVVSDEKTCAKRFFEATGYGQNEYNSRMANQLTATEKAKKADFVINNNGTLDKLRQEVHKIIKQVAQQ